MTTWEIRQGDVLERLAEMPDNSVHCVITSPPYFALRDYGTGQWEGGDSECDHKPDVRPRAARANPGGSNIGKGGAYNDAQDAGTSAFRDLCGKCGARRIDRQIGLEATPAEFVQTMVRVFREVRRVLRPDGTLWLNLGDSYAQNSKAMKTDKEVEQWQAKKDAGEFYGGVAAWGKRGARAANTAGAGMKPKDLMMMPARVAIALQEDGWWLRSDIIWCLSGGTRLYARTQKGDMPATLKDLVRLDPSTVQLWNGERWTQVTAWTQSPTRYYALEIVLRSGERIGCTPEHLWPTQRGDVRADELLVGDVIPTCDLPEPEKPNVPAALDDRAVGWFVGLYLAEGFTDSKSIRIAGHQKEDVRLERCGQIAAAFGGTCTIRKTSDNGVQIRIHSRILKAIIETYVSGVGAAGKHLTSAAWQRSNVFLEALMLGYLEGDAHYDEGNDRYRLGFTNNDAWAGDIRTLSARLGYSCRLRRCQHQMGARRFPGWRGEVRFTWSQHRNTKPNGEIVSIGRSRARQFWDVSVADEPHLFALASGVLTHNCKRAPMPESVTDRPTTAHEHIFLLTKRASYFYDSEAVREQGNGSYNGSTFTNGKTPIPHPNVGQGERTERPGRNMWSYWLLSPEPFPAAHFATFPTEIPRRAILAGTSEWGCCAECGAPWKRVVEPTPEYQAKLERGRQSEAWKASRRNEALSIGVAFGDKAEGGSAERITKGWQPTCSCNAEVVPATVLDPFSGAGTTVLVANRLGRRGVGIELNPAYVEMARRRIIGDAPLFAWADDKTAEGVA